MSIWPLRYSNPLEGLEGLEGSNRRRDPDYRLVGKKKKILVSRPCVSLIGSELMLETVWEAQDTFSTVQEQWSLQPGVD